MVFLHILCGMLGCGQTLQPRMASPCKNKNDFAAVMIAAWKSQKKHGNVMLSFVAGNDGEIPSLKLT